jgi:hypothetical protein
MIAWAGWAVAGCLAVMVCIADYYLRKAYAREDSYAEMIDKLLAEMTADEEAKP